MDEREGKAMRHAVRASPKKIGDQADIGRKKALGACEP